MANGPLLEPSQALRDLEALEAISESPSISQRDLSKRLGIALGLTNACVKRMANAGLIKISRVNGRSLAYHLTPAGFAAKAKLSLEYARTTVDFYRYAKQAITENLQTLQAMGVSRIGVLGATDVAEIIQVVCAHLGLEIAYLADDREGMGGTQFLGHEVGSISGLEPAGCEAVIVAYLDDTDFWVEHLRQRLEPTIQVISALAASEALVSAEDPATSAGESR